MIAVASVILALRSLHRMNRKLHEVEDVERSLRQSKVIFHNDHSPLSSESSKEK